MKPFLPLEIRNKIIDLSYKLMYNDVLNEFKIYLPENDFISFYFPFKRYIITIPQTIAFMQYDDSDSDSEDENEVVFFDLTNIFYLE